MREYSCIKKGHKKYFLKKYSDVKIHEIVEEYNKSLMLSHLTNYPKPIEFSTTTIMYEWINIKYSFEELNNKGKLTNAHIKQLASMISTIHKEGVYHGDLGFRNIVIDTKNKVWLIDAGVRVDREVPSKYFDLSRIVAQLKYLKPITKPHLIFNRNNNKKVRVFLDNYNDILDEKTLKHTTLVVYKKYRDLVLKNNNYLSYLFWFLLVKVLEEK